MGRNNRQRRREKQRKRRATTARRAEGLGRAEPAPVGDQPSGCFRPPDVDLLVQAAVEALQRGADHLFDAFVDDLLMLWDVPGAGGTAPAVLGSRLEEAVRLAWPQGWRPADLVRAVKRKLGAHHSRLVAQVIRGEARSWRESPTADPVWLDQLADLPGRPSANPSLPLLPEWARAEGRTAREALQCGLELLAALWHFPNLPLIGPPPHEWGRDPGPRTARRRPQASSLDPKVLARVRALLAKAESTSFPKEAEALSAKAQQLMARHAIDQTMLEPEAEHEPAARRLAVDDPYAAAKSLLLDKVAEACRSRAVWTPDLGFSTVFGFPVDLEVVEILYTSLLVQGTTAMVAAGSGPGSGRRTRSRSFRQSFLVAYAIRIGHRLQESAEATVAEAQEDHGDALLPVLAGRSRDVDEARDRAFPNLRSRSYGVTDGMGWAAGVVAADQASLAVGPELSAASRGFDAA